MSTLTIVTIDTDLLALKYTVLRQRSCEVPPQEREYSKLCRELAVEMFEVMYATYGAALAAPQVGVPLRLIVMDPARLNFGPHVLINPVINFKSASEEAEDENCLSLPYHTGKVYRSTEVRVHAYDLNGEFKEYHAEGLLARIFQHELDHLDGILYPDRLRRGDYLEKSDNRGARRRAIEAINRLHMVFL